MRITSVFAVLVLAFSPLALAGHTGECGASTEDGKGKTVACSCDQRPNCGEEGDCSCIFDKYCKDTKCDGKATLADTLGSDDLPAFPPEPATTR